MDTGELRRKRAALFWRAILPYLKYVVSSGLAAFLFIAFIIFTHYYAGLIERLPAQLPVDLIAWALLCPVMIIHPIRTYLQSADIIFLLPAEHRLHDYFKLSLRRSLVLQSVITAVIWLAVWPLYRAGMEVTGSVFWLILFMLLVMKGVNLYGRWQELQLVAQTVRRRFVLLRILLQAVLLYVMLAAHGPLAILIIAAILIIYLLLLRQPAKFNLNWELLISKEQLQSAKYYTFLSWFVDIPEMKKRVHHRHGLSHLTKLLAFKQRNAYRFLYLKTLIRSEIPGMVLRFLLLGMVMIALLPQVILKAVIFLCFVYFIGVQLSALEQYHRYSIWIHLYPLPSVQRIQSVVAVVAWVQLMLLMLLSIPLWYTLSSPMHALYTLLAGLALFIIQQIQLRRSWTP